MLDAGGFSQLRFPFTTYLAPATGYTVEMDLVGSDYTLERGCTGETGDMAGYWRFDSIDSRGISDLTVNGNDGTFQGTVMNGTVNGLVHNATLGSTASSDTNDPSWTADCADRGCLAFDGSDDYVTVPDHAALEPTDGITVMMWMTPRTGTTHSRVADDDGFNIYWESGVADRRERPVRMYLKGADGNRHYADGISRQGSQNVTAGERAHIALTYNGTHIREYVRGSLAAETIWSGSLDVGNSDLYIGSYGAGDSRRLNGTIDDVRIYDRGLSGDEVRAAMNGEPPGDGIIAAYPFDEGSGQTAWNNVFQAPRQDGQGMRFDGATGHHVEVADAPRLDIDESFTWSAWVYLRERTGDNTVFGKRGAYELSIEGSSMKIVSWGDDWHPSYTFPTGEWHHVAVTGQADGSSRTLYIDGTQVASGGPSYTMSVSGNPLQVGRWPDQDGNGVNGTVDDLRIYDRALSRAEVRSDMRGEPPAPGIVAYYPLDAPTGRTVWNSAFWRQGKQGGAVAFDGTTTFIHVPHAPDLNMGSGPFTIATWMKHQNADNVDHAGIVAKGPDNSLGTCDQAQYVFRHAYDSPREMWFKVCDGANGAGIRQNYGTGDGTWHHYAVGRNSSHVFVAVDGTVRAVSSTSGVGSTDNAYDLAIGAQTSGGGGQILNGTLDDLRIYGRSLTPAEISALYNATN